MDVKTEEKHTDALDYEKDPRFIDFIKSRLEKTIADRELGTLVDSETVFVGIREKHGW